MTKLVNGEQVRIRTRADSGALIAPAVWFVLISLGLGFWLGFLAIPNLPWAFANYHNLWTWLGYLVAILLFYVLCVRPVWSWLTQAFEITTHRVAQRYGTLNVRRRWVALSAIVHMTIRQTRRQRQRGTGNLQLFTAQGQSWTLVNVPKIEEFTRLVEAERFVYATKFGPGIPQSVPDPARPGNYVPYSHPRVQGRF